MAVPDADGGFSAHAIDVSDSVRPECRETRTASVALRETSRAVRKASALIQAEREARKLL